MSNHADNMDEFWDTDWDDGDPEPWGNFIGECTCDHEEDDHSWGSCDQLLSDATVCPCTAGWEE